MGKRTEYNRAWRKAHWEEIKARHKQYMRDHPEKWKAYYQANREKLREKSKKWYAKNKDTVDANYKIYYESNKDKMRQRSSLWQRNNTHASNANCRKYHASKLNATPQWADDFIIREIYHLAALRTKYTGSKWHVDHIVPLRSKLVCGLHVEHNLRVIPATINLRKHNTIWPDMP